MEGRPASTPTSAPFALALRARGSDFAEADSLLRRQLEVYEVATGMDHPTADYALQALGTPGTAAGRRHKRRQVVRNAER